MLSDVITGENMRGKSWQKVADEMYAKLDQDEQDSFADLRNRTRQ